MSNARPTLDTRISAAVNAFVATVVRLTEDDFRQRVLRSAIQARGNHWKQSAKTWQGLANEIGKFGRKRAPKQLCPVPGCKNPAAPVFHMVCAKHKDVPKSKIKAYRAARRKKVGHA